MIIPLLKGLATTLRMVFTKHITLQYPEERRQVSPRWRGHPELTINEDGSRRCVACTLCMVVCPSNAIKGIMADESEDHGKYPIAFIIDLQRCIFCGFCQEACPKGAIKLNNLYELAQYDKQMLILDIERATQSKSQLRLEDWL
jgi:NADH-quinone oxidoreductase subunit I